MSSRAPLSVLALVLVAAFGCKPREADPGSDDKAAKAPASKVEGAEGAEEPAPPEGPAGDSMAFASEPCKLAMAVVERLDIYAKVDQSLDPAKVEEILAHQPQAGGKTGEGATVLDWVAEADLALGRMSENRPQDRDMIEALARGLAAEDQEGMRRDLARIVAQLRAVAFLKMRHQLGEVAAGRLREDPARAAWAEAQCLWEGGLRPLARRAEELPRRGGEGWEATLDEAFAESRAALDDPELVRVKAAKQQTEKGMYAVFHHLVIAAAEDGEGGKSGPASAEALGLLDALEDRLADRNGPGLVRMREAFAGDPAALDAAAVSRELGVAFAKRARKYCDKAVKGGELGTPDAMAETWEGIVYTRVILPDMREALAAEGFDGDAYLADWQAYREAVEGADTELAAEISPRLVEWNCAYQDSLGIAECSASSNETQ